MARQARIDAAGLLHHVMIRGIERRNIFRDDGDRNNFIERLALLLPETGTICYAWSLMPNHAHLLLRSGPNGITTLMRRLLTGYAVTFNRGHHRTGRLFQNRYKSIICQEDAYLRELVRYIHLNPLRTKIVLTLSDLDRFAYSGHSALMNRKKRSWQDTDYILRLFGDDIEEGRKRYRAFVDAGLDQGRREDLSGGGLIRSIGGWSLLKNTRARGDQRILGDSGFVLKTLKDADERLEQVTALRARGYTLDMLADKVASFCNLDRSDILSKGRRKERVTARSLFCYLAASRLRTSITDLARLIGMAPSAISYAVTRGKAIAEELNFVDEELLKK
jgi:putative transposase